MLQWGLLLLAQAASQDVFLSHEGFDVPAEIPSVMGRARGATFNKLAQDSLVSVPLSTAQTVISSTMTLSDKAQCLFVSDGRFFPSGKAVAMVWMAVDGKRVGTSQVIDWASARSGAAVQHAFHLVGLADVPAGNHSVALMAASLNGAAFKVGSNSAVGALPLAGGIVAKSVVLSDDSGPFGFDMPVWDNKSVPYVLRHKPIVELSVPTEAGGSIVALASGRSFLDKDAKQGDAFWMVYLDGNDHISNNATLHSDNDICYCAEAGNAPMMTHGFFENVPYSKHYVVSLDASAEPWSTPSGVNHVQDKVGEGSGLIALTGFPISGRAVLTSRVDYPLDYVCVASSKSWGSCPPVGKDVIFASATFTVPAGHSGEMAFFAKSLTQADGADEGGNVAFQLRLDGQNVGSIGLQQLIKPNSVSTRTISSTYVAAGDMRLKPGEHTIEAVVKVTGDFAHLCFVKDLPLLFIG